MNIKGSILDPIIWIILVFIVAMFFGVWMYGHGVLTNTLSGIDSRVGIGNDFNRSIGEVADDTFGQVDSAYQTYLPIIGFAIIFGMILTILISSFLVRVHPVFIVAYVLILVLAIILSVYISNAYEDFLTGEVFSSQLQSMGAVTFVLLHLPIWVTVIGFLGIFLLMAGIPRDSEYGGIS